MNNCVQIDSLVFENMRWKNLKNALPPENNRRLMLYIPLTGMGHFVEYLPARKGSQYGDWYFYSENVTKEAKETDRWIDLEDLFLHDSLNGSIAFKVVRSS